MKYLVTGATGFIGRNLISRIKNPRVIVRKNKNSRGICDRAEVVEAELDNIEALQRATKGVDVVIHLAAIIDSRNKDIRRINVDATKLLVEAARKNRVKKFICLSTYLAENPDDEYSRTKREAEEIIKDSGINYVILRAGVVYGTADQKNIGKLIKFVRKFPIVPIIGDGKYKMQPIFIDDVVRAIFRAEQMKGTYYVLGPQISYNELVGVIVRKIKKKRLVVHVPFFVAKTLLWIIPVFNIKQISHVMNFAPKDIHSTSKPFGFTPISFEEGLSKILA